MKQSILTVEKLRIGFKSKTGINTAVHELSFELNAGETLAIVGESGSGKSISSLALLGLLPKSATIESGSVHLHGQDILKMKESELRRIRGGKIAMIFQEPMTALTPVLSIGEQLIEGILCHQMISKQQAYKTAVEMLRVARIPEAEKRMQQFPHQLSGGMRQRVMIAMALACRPQILVADEPTTALDVTVQAQILSLMKTLQQEFGTAIILVTHDMGVVAEMADRVLVMCQGRQIEKGTVLQVLKTPQAAYTQKLLGAVPVMGNVKDSRQLISASVSARPLLEINDLSVRFDIREGLLSRVKSRVHAVEQVSFSIAKGETLALVGESGSGKSTIGRAILNLIPIETGAVRFKGRDITGWSNRLMRPLRNDMQMIFQDPMASLNPRNKVWKLVAEPMQIHTRCSKAERYQKTLKLFERVGLSEQDMQRYPHQFSGGQRQRICIARALATDPDIIVADECVSALDVSVQAQIIELMKSLQDERCLSYLFISHDLAVVEQISHRVAVMNMGQIVELGDTQSVLHMPQHVYTQKLIAAVPSIDPEQTKLTQKGLIQEELLSPIKPIGYKPTTSVIKKINSSGSHWILDQSHQYRGNIVK